MASSGFCIELDEYGRNSGTYFRESFRTKDLLKSLAVSLRDHALRGPDTVQESHSNGTARYLTMPGFYVGILHPDDCIPPFSIEDLEIYSYLNPNRSADPRPYDWRNYITDEKMAKIFQYEVGIVLRAVPRTFGRYDPSNSEAVVQDWLYATGRTLLALVKHAIVQAWINVLEENAHSPDENAKFMHEFQAALPILLDTSVTLPKQRLHSEAKGDGQAKGGAGKQQKGDDDASKPSRPVISIIESGGIIANVGAKAETYGSVLDKQTEITTEAWLDEVLTAGRNRERGTAHVLQLYGLYSKSIFLEAFKMKAIKRLGQMVGHAKHSISKTIYIASIYNSARIGFLVPISHHPEPYRLFQPWKQNNLTAPMALLLTDNIFSEGFPVGKRSDLDHCEKILTTYFNYLLMAILVSQDKAFWPPNWRHHDWRIPEIQVRAEPFIAKLQSWVGSRFQRIVEFCLSTFLVYLLCQVIGLRLDKIDGCFLPLDHRISFQIRPLRVRCLTLHEGRQVFVHRNAGFIFKTFQNEVDFSHEYEIYQYLSDHATFSIPPLLGAFYNESDDIYGLMIGDVGWSLQEEIDEDGDRLKLQDLRTISIILRSLHNLGVHHHDLKPDNIIRGHDGQIKITDFGNASWVEAGSLCEMGSCCLDKAWLL